MKYLTYAIPYCIFLNKLSDNVYKALGGEQTAQSEFLNNLLKEQQECIEIEDESSDTSAKKPEEGPTEEYTAIEEDEDEKEGLGNPTTDMHICFKSFKIIKKIGEGSYGKVFKVQMQSTGEIFAMKGLSKEFMLKTNNIKYAISECQLLASVDNPFIIKMHYSFQTPKYLYFILDFCSGGDLASQISNKHILEEHEAKFYIAELILAIEYLHSRNIIYRDLKPENVLLGMFHLYIVFYRQRWACQAFRLWFSQANAWSKS